MASSILEKIDPEEIISCPYNKAHQIIRSRMQTHLVRCSKNYPDINLRVCMFNVVHKIPEPEYKFHLENCPDRHKIDKLYYTKSDTSSIQRFPITEVELDCDESWENVNVPSYNPSKACEAKPVLRQLNVAPPSERKNFRYQERQRLQALEQLKGQEVAPRVEKACDFAQRARTGPSRPITDDIDETDPYQVTSLLERIRLGAVPIKPMDKSKHEQTDIDTAVSDVENSGFVTKSKKGFGRGRLIKKN